MILYTFVNKIQWRGKTERLQLKAAGEDQKLEGIRIGPIRIEIGDNLFVRQVVVAAIKDQMLMGIDMLEAMDAKIDIIGKTLTCNQQQIQLEKEQKAKEPTGWKPYAAVLKQTVRIRPETEMVIPTAFHFQRLGAGDRYLEPKQNMCNF